MGAISIAVLLVWAMDLGFRGVWDSVWPIATKLGTMVVTGDISGLNLTRGDKLTLLIPASYLIEAALSLLLGFLLSRYLYGCGLSRSIRKIENLGYKDA